MSDKSFGDYANRNIVKNPLLSTAVTGLSIEDLTHNAVLVPVAPNQGLITGLDQTGPYTQTLVNADHELTNLPSGDSNSNFLLPQPSMSSHSYAQDSQIRQHHDPKPELQTASVSKASAKSEDDFDVNEYFARLQGTRYVSAPLHTHQDPTNLADAEENLEEINLNDDKNVEIQQSLTADIAQNFSQLPNVLPHVASAVFSSFSNMWSMKSREHTPDDRSQGYQDVQYNKTQTSNQIPSHQGSSYQDVQFKANQNPGLGQFQDGPGLGAAVPNVPLMNTENVVKEVAPPPKEPPVCGTSNFRITSKKKYAQIPGLATRETQQIAFNPVTTNVPSYFIPKDNNQIDIGQTIEPVRQEIKNTRLPPDNKEEYNIFNPIDDSKTVASDCQPSIFMPIEQPKLIEETQSINLQNQSPIIPPPPMFSAPRRDDQSGKSVLPPSVARRIGSNHPVIKQHVVQKTVTDNIFVPTFDSAGDTEPIVADVTSQQPSSVPMFASVNSQIKEQPTLQSPPTVIGPATQPTHTSKSIFPEPATHAIFGLSEPVGFSCSNSSFTQGPTLPPSSNIFAPPPTISQMPSNLGQIQPNIGPTLLTPPASFTKNIASQADLPPIQQQINPTHISAFSPLVTTTVPPTGVVQEQPEPPKPPIEPPKAVGASNFRMTKKRPQYYSGPIEGIGSISNSIKPTLPVIDSGTFQGALFTPEHQTDVNAPSFDLNKQTQANASYTPFDITNQATNLPTVPIESQTAYPNYHVTQPTQNYEQYNTAFDLSRSTENYDYKDEPQESKGFGIIGSLKSKLSNLDINKIQNSVTTFFDPAYNDTKKDATAVQENLPYQTQYDAHTQSNFEIFVPHVEQTQPYYNYRSDQCAHAQPDQAYSNKYNYQNQGIQYPDLPASYQYYQGNYSVPSHSTTHAQISNVYTNTIPHRSFDGQERTDNTSKVSESYDDKDIKHDTEIVDQVTKNVPPHSILIPTTIESAENKSNVLLTETKEEEMASTERITHVFETQKPQNILETPQSKLEILDSIYSGNIFDEYKTQPPVPIASEIKSYITPKVKFEENHSMGAFSNIGLDNLTKDVKTNDVPEQRDVKGKDETPKGDNLLESLTKGEVPILGVASVPLFGLSTIIADKSRDVETSEMMSLPLLFDKTQSKDTLDRVASMSLFENIGSLPQKSLDANEVKNKSASFSLFDKASLEKDNVPNVSFFANDGNLDHCDIAANVDVMLDRKKSLFDRIGDVTEELSLKRETVIENDETGLQGDIENVSELNICETCREFNKPEEKELEIEDLTTHLIENITSPIQLSNAVEVPLTEDSNTERVEFDADQFEEISHITEETIGTIHVQSATELLDDDDVKTMNYGWTTDDKYEDGSLKHHDFGFKVEPSSIGFFGDSLFNDNVQANASDELKAEYKHQEDLVPSQMGVPSAPPAEDDSKSDETGILDVHSIELDAKEDFPIYEEYAKGPSETDEDKNRNKEREKTEGSDFDSFTNRVEKFKKMEEVADIEESKMMPKYFELSSQPISMASYFDTGNYAADTHYRNTMSSPSHISIPPGFEEEFKKRLAISKILEQTKVPDTQTQTKTTISLTFSTAHLSYSPATSIFTSRSAMPVGFNVEANVSKIVDDKSDNLSQSSDIVAPRSIEVPNASSIFCAAVEETISPPHLTMMAKSQHIIGSGVKMAETSNIFGAVKSNTPGPSALNSSIPSGSSIEKSEPETKLPDPEPAESFSRLASYFNSPPKTEHAKSFFELSQSQNHYRHASIPEKYRDLISDLTSVQNLAIPTNQNIRQVNYFTVERDVTTSEITLDDHFKDNTETDDQDVNLLTNCRYCVKIINKRLKVKTAMNDDSEKGQTGANMLSTPDQHTRHSVTVNFEDLPPIEEANQNVGSVPEHTSNAEYIPVKHHWFYRVDIDDKSIWRGFSVTDSMALEAAYLSPDLNDSTMVPTDGGRYDVNVVGRLRIPVYWDDKPTNVRRCSWFYKGTTDPRFVPYTEAVADKLETEYLHGMMTGEWHRRLVLPNGEVVVMHGPAVMVHFLSNDAFTTPPYFSFGKRVYRNPPKIRVARDIPKEIDHLIFLVHGAGEYRYQKEKSQSASRPRVVRRGHDESEIEDPEPSSIDHLLLLCHGVGSACDMRFRSVEEVVEDFRATSLQLLQSHYKNSYDQGIVNRVEVLPISWHATLHSGETGVDRRLQCITLDSIPRLRNFTNDTVLDVLFYTSPVFCQTILNTVCQEMNRIYELFKLRNPNFKGGVSLGGHSLGSVILYDLLCNQKIPETELNAQKSTKMYVPSSACKMDSHIKYPTLLFKPEALYALGSPIAIFECIRGVESLGANFSLPTCKKFFNIFHPYDPIAYRIEPLINPSLRDLKPFLIPHHKGRKRMHLELKDTMVRVGTDLKQKLLESLKCTWNKWKAQPVDGSLDSVMEAEIEADALVEDTKEKDAKETELCTPEMLGHLNSGRRIDYVLQEAPLEMINEYLFAMSSHVGYWESEDTMLLMLREIYSAVGIQPDSTVPQQNMSVERTRLQDNSVMITDNPSTSKTKTK